MEQTNTQQQREPYIIELINLLGIPKICKSYIGCNIAVFPKTTQEFINISKKNHLEVIKLYSVYYKIKLTNTLILDISNRQNTYYSLSISQEDLNYLKDKYQDCLILEGY